MRYMNATFEHPDWMLHPMQSFIRREDAVAYEELLAWNFLRGEDFEYELFYVVGDLDRYRAFVETVDNVRWHNITVVDDDSFLVYACQDTRPADRVFRAAFENLELVVVPPIRFDSQATISMTLVGEGENLQAVLDRTPDEISVTVNEIGEYDHRHGTIAGVLTDRQYEAVRAAVELGYYEKPRSASLDDVADALGCASSTASNHLQKAEAAVMQRLVQH